LRDDPAGTHSLADLARRAKLSPSRFQHLFEEATGVPVRRYKIWSRMGCAVRAMAAGDSLCRSLLYSALDNAAGSLFDSRFQSLDHSTERAVRSFLARTAALFPVSVALLFGSRARGTSSPESDVDLAIVLRGSPGRRVDKALRMAGIAFEVLLETGVLIEAIPLWENEWDHPETFNNPALLENIRRDGISL
jgi:predicted nucleotidyltransferase